MMVLDDMSKKKKRTRKERGVKLKNQLLLPPPEIWLLPLFFIFFTIFLFIPPFSNFPLFVKSRATEREIMNKIAM